MEESTIGLLDEIEAGRSGATEKTSLTKGHDALRSIGQATSWLKTLFIVGIYILAAVGVLSLVLSFRYSIWSPTVMQDVYRPQTMKPELNLCDCGRNTVEAVAKGCKFDILAAAWLPPHCRDDALTVEFEQSGPGINKQWTYFADRNGTTKVHASKLAQLGDGERSFFTTREWHISHCLFYWEKYVRMRDTGVVLEKRFEGVRHPRHCRQMIMGNDGVLDQLLEIWVHMNARDFD